MNTLRELYDAVHTTLASQRLGTPVFVRYVLHRSSRKEAVLAQLARIAAVVCGWLGAGVEKVYALGTLEQRHITLTLEFRNGATALVTWIGTAGRGSGIDLMVVGNHGVLYHDTADGDWWDQTPVFDRDPADRDLLVLLERALRSGRPETAATGGRP